MSRSSRRIRAIQAAPARPATQRGMALAVSMVLLIAITIVGVTTLSGTRLNERIVSNSQQKAISFEVAESAINSVWTVDDMLDSLALIPSSVFNDPDAVVPPGIAAQLSVDYDQNNANGVAVDVTAGVTIRYCGETTLPTGSSLSADESTLQMAGAMFDINGTASIAGSNAVSDHVQRGYIVRPKTGRTGACVVPGV